MTRSISATDFKARCLELMDDVRQHRREIVVTKHGKPVAKLVPYEEKPPSAFGVLAGTVTYVGDITGPTGETWDADAE